MKCTLQVFIYSLHRSTAVYKVNIYTPTYK